MAMAKNSNPPEKNEPPEKKLTPEQKERFTSDGSDIQFGEEPVDAADRAKKLAELGDPEAQSS